MSIRSGKMKKVDFEKERFALVGVGWGGVIHFRGGLG